VAAADEASPSHFGHHIYCTQRILYTTELSRAVGVRRGGGGGGQFGGGYNRGFAGGGGMGYYRSPFSMWFSPFDLFYYWSPRYPARQRERLERGEGYNFLEGIFSFGAPRSPAARALALLRER